MIEVTFAVGIAAFCLVVLFSLLPAGLRSIKESNDAVGGRQILQSIWVDLRTAVSSNASNSQRYSVPLNGVTNLGFSGVLQLTNQTDAYYQLRTSLINGAQGCEGKLVVWWPARAAETNAIGKVEAFVAIPD